MAANAELSEKLHLSYATYWELADGKDNFTEIPSFVVREDRICFDAWGWAIVMKKSPDGQWHGDCEENPTIKITAIASTEAYPVSITGTWQQDGNIGTFNAKLFKKGS